MTPAFDDGDVRAYLGDCMAVMSTFPPASVDAIVTDPPYGLGFMGKEWDSLPPGLEWSSACARVLKPGGHLLAFGGTRTFHRLACAIEDAGFEIRDTLSWLYGQGFPKSLNLDGEWQGWGTALKPSWEPVVVARKPLTGTVAGNVLEHGTGALNIDGCRIGGGGHLKWSHPRDMGYHGGTDNDGAEAGVATSGRWPANVALDSEAAVLLDAQAGERGGVAPASGATFSGPSGRSAMAGGFSGMGDREPRFYGDTGGASRFFYTAKASGDEREGNHHPTVKPVALMRWLVRLVTPPGGLVLDPFAGSGTTGVACRAEGFRCVLIEREPEYLEIVRRRLSQLSLLGGTA